MRSDSVETRRCCTCLSQATSQARTWTWAPCPSSSRRITCDLSLDAALRLANMRCLAPCRIIHLAITRPKPPRPPTIKYEASWRSAFCVLRTGGAFSSTSVYQPFNTQHKERRGTHHNHIRWRHHRHQLSNMLPRLHQLQGLGCFSHCVGRDRRRNLNAASVQ